MSDSYEAAVEVRDALTSLDLTIRECTAVFCSVLVAMTTAPGDGPNEVLGVWKQVNAEMRKQLKLGSVQ